MRDDSLDLLRVILQFFQRRFYRLVDDFQHAAASEQFVFHGREIRFDSSRITIHEKADRAGGGQHRHLGIAVTVTLAESRRSLPGYGSFVL